MDNPFDEGPRGYRLSAAENVVRGQRFEPPLLPTGRLDRNVLAQMIRAEDKTGKISLWQITLSPVFRKATGPNIEGQPSRFAGSPGAGLFDGTLTWGGGGVTYRTTFKWPVNGSSFVVSGDNIMLEARSQDASGTYTEANRPAIEAWVTPNAQPQSMCPLTWLVSSPGATPLRPFSRVMTVTKDTVGATVLVSFDGFPYAQLEATDSVLVLPVLSDAETVTLTASAGIAHAFVELGFT